MLEVVGPQVVCTPPGGSQCEEGLDQTHRWPHAHVHLTKVDEDRHQHEGVQHQMVKLEIIVLQQREKEGGRWECEPGQGVGGKLDDFNGP
jgi:hypothetical protein